MWTFLVIVALLQDLAESGVAWVVPARGES
jgi:hypothetical protein